MSEDSPESNITGVDDEDSIQNHILTELVDEWKEDSNNPALSQMARQRAWEDAKQLEEIINE